MDRAEPFLAAHVFEKSRILGDSDNGQDMDEDTP
jgi:hypothetical protein